MAKSKIVKKDLHQTIKQKIISGELIVVDNNGVILDIEPDIKLLEKNTILSNNKKFMKKLTDRALSLRIKKGLSMIEKEILFDILDYIDDENMINFKKLAFDYGYTSQKISKVKKMLAEKGIIRQKDGFFYLTPLVGYTTKEISKELIDLFQDTFKNYGVEIKF